MVFMNCIVALTFTRKNFFNFSKIQFFGDCSMKTSPSKTKNSYENLSPVPTLSYTIIKMPKEFFAPQKSLRLLKLLSVLSDNIAQKTKFSIKDFFSKRDQIRKKLQIWSHLQKKYLMENFIFCAV